MAREHAELERQLGAPETHADARLAKRLNQRYAQLSRVLTAKKEWDDLEGDIEAARELAAEDPTFADEVETLAERRHAAEERLRLLLVPRDPTDDKDAILEVKSGEGGEESALFAGDLLRMYSRYAEQRGWKVEVLDATESDLGGYKSVTLAVKAKGTPEPGEAPYGLLKFEGGVHRVQRVPVTESQGRVHTSAAGVLVLPEAEQVDVTHRRERPAHRRLPQQRAGRPERQHHRLRGPHHPRPDRDRGQLPEREEPAPEQGAGAAHPPCPAAGRGAGGGRRRRQRRPAQPGPHRRPLRADPDLQLPGEPHLRPPHRLQGLQPRPGPRRRPPAGPRLLRRGWTSPTGWPRSTRDARADARRGRGRGGPREAGVPSPEHDAAELLAHVLGTDRSRLPLVDEVPADARSGGTTRSWPGARPASRCST